MKLACLALCVLAATAAVPLPAAADPEAWRPNWSLEVCLEFAPSSSELSAAGAITLRHLYAVTPSQAPLDFAFLQVESDIEENVALDATRMLQVKRRIQSDLPRVRTVSTLLFHRSGPNPWPNECPDGQVKLTFHVAKQFFPTIPCLDPWQKCRVRCQGEACELQGR